jgi:hypothetical protein
MMGFGGLIRVGVKLDGHAAAAAIVLQPQPAIFPCVCCSPFTLHPSLAGCGKTSISTC